VLYALPALEALGGRFELHVGSHSLAAMAENEHTSRRAVADMARLFPSSALSAVPDGYGNTQALKRLLELQPCIEAAVPLAAGFAADIDLCAYRDRGFNPGRHIADQTLEHFGFPAGQWRQRAVLRGVDPDPRYAGRVVCARSFRYRHDRKAEAWRRRVGQLCDRHGTTPLFVGLPAEHADFEAKVMPAELADTRDMLDVARVIRASAAGVYNSSAPHAVAQLLGLPVHTECLGVPSWRTSLCVEDFHNAF
jgi:hypothetical protein